MDGTSCLVQPNVAGNFDIICGDAVIGQLTNGAPGAPGPQGPQGIDGAFAGKGDPGEPGVACSGTQEAASPANPYGGVRITCGTQQFFVSNGAPGQGGVDGPSGDCSILSVTVPVTNDKAITLTCTDQRSATVLVCPPGSAAAEGSTGLLLDDNGKTGQCLADGTISRGTTVKLSNICGSTLFDPQSSFCQRTISTATSTDFGSFAELDASGAVVAGEYPYSKDAITDPESPYNSTNLKAGANAVVLPLCGVYPATKADDILDKHTSSTVYDANNYCARNLVIKIGSGTAGRYGASDGAEKNGKPISGSAADNDATQSYGDAWSVIAKGSCLINLLEDGGKINGYNYTSQSNSDAISRACSWIEADSLDVPGASKYTFCPTDRPVVALDDIKCIARTGCIYHSTIDNTCLGQDSKVSTDGAVTGGSVVVPSKITGTPNKGGVPSGWTYEVTDHVGSGIKSTSVGSRFGLGTIYSGSGVNNTGFLNAGGNLWSKACVTQTRTVYYAVNDKYLSNKAFKEDNATTTGTTVEGPTCGGVKFMPPGGTLPTDSVTQQPVAFENAVVCLKGQLSLDAKQANGQSIGYDGTSWDKPLYCVQLDYGLEAFCKITHSSIVSKDYCDGINGLDKFYDVDGNEVSGVKAAGTPGSALCKIVTSGGNAPTETVCKSIRSTSRPSLSPIPQNLTVQWNTTSGLGTDHTGKAGGCLVSSTGKKTVAGAEVPYLDKDACEGINTASHDGYVINGTISALWRTGIVTEAAKCNVIATGLEATPAQTSETACLTLNGTCTGNSATTIAACDTYGDANGSCSGSGTDGTEANRSACEAKGATAVWAPAASWTPVNTWVAGGNVDVCQISSTVPGAIAADNCNWIDFVSGSIPGGNKIAGPSVTWTTN